MSNSITDAGIIEDNDQVQARLEHLRELKELVGNVYPNRFDRTRISGAVDTITDLNAFAPIAEVVSEIKGHIKTLGEGERPNSEIKDLLNERLRVFGNVRVSGRLTTTPRTMGKAAFVHLSDGKNRIQIYVRKDDAQGVSNDFDASPLLVWMSDSDSENPKSKIQNPKSIPGWDIFRLLDGGDFVGVEGFLFLTNTGELSVHVEKLQFLTKSLLPMPDKMHGIADPEIRQRQRYADLIASSLQVEHEGLTTREVFEVRAKVISSIRRFLEDDGYIEVETPMLTPKATGAAAKPFATHHNALDITLYARIAPELYLKRLTVGGFEKVYELNRNFRNEGISYKHNPEFTMLEFYCAYMDVNGMMDFCELLLRHSVERATGGLIANYDGNKIDFGSFKKFSMRESINEFLPAQLKRALQETGVPVEGISDVPALEALRDLCSWFERLSSLEITSITAPGQEGPASAFVIRNDEIDEAIQDRRLAGEPVFERTGVTGQTPSSVVRLYWESLLSGARNRAGIDSANRAELIVEIFELSIEKRLIQPTFIIDFPKSISPLSKASPANPEIAERFELFINGMEVANGFSELNDPQEQYERFLDQMNQREKGDDEAMVLDEDYIRALSYGMPPAAGIGIGIDRLVMLLTNKHSIRDVILFPHLRPERRDEE